jgi:DNA-directed RNA polymerase specialized sigma subunit
MMNKWNAPKSFNDFPDQPSPKHYMEVDEDIEWLMQPLVYENPEKESLELSELMADVMESMDTVDQQMLHLIYYERKTFQEAARELGIKAKSHAWRKTQSALEKFGDAIKSNPQIMEILNNKYDLGE